LARQFGIEHEVFDGEEMRRRYPGFNTMDDDVAYFEPGGGFVRPEAAVSSQLELAASLGASLHYQQPVTAITKSGSGMEVATSTQRYAAAHVVICAGAWVRNFIEDPANRDTFKVFRQEMHWFGLDQHYAKAMSLAHCPTYAWAFGSGPVDYFYGFPALDGTSGGVKVATEQYVHQTTAETVERAVDKRTAIEMYNRCIRGRVPALLPSPIRSASCLYTVTPDHGFVIDTHPEHQAATLVSACSGHGFKQSAAIGEAVAQRVLESTSQIDLTPFALSRFTRGTAGRLP
jgi:sarcosine oxidase